MGEDVGVCASEETFVCCCERDRAGRREDDKESS